ncbi:MAG: DNA adenine methylase [Blastocatellia bacterium]|nr:DNA adenine methylase [Blastocatellia bacterium]
MIIARPRPFIKWAGGKRRLLEQYAPHLPSQSHFKRYLEPFLGGGALFFYLRPEKAILADLNEELINCYLMVKQHPEELIDRLKRHKVTSSYFYEMRKQEPLTLSPLERASRFIYLNKTCYNGLYRVNSSGQFNVPFGKSKSTSVCDESVIRTASITLQNAHLKVSSFEDTVSEVVAGDFVYFDPPYVPLSQTASFTNYTSPAFTDRDQDKLASIARELSRKGVLVIVSNSNTEMVHRLYRGFRIELVRCNRAINSNTLGRGAVDELLIKNF